MKRLSRQYQLGITLAVGQILDSDILAVFDKLYVLSRGGLCVYEGSVEHLHLYLREANVMHLNPNAAVENSVSEQQKQRSTPMERLIKIASKPSKVRKCYPILGPRIENSIQLRFLI